MQRVAEAAIRLIAAGIDDVTQLENNSHAVPDTQPQSTAVLLIAHGSRRKEANDDLVRLAEIVRQRRPDTLVEASYLELAFPSIPEGARNCIEQGAQSVLMLPYFLSAGAHVVSDLQRFRDELTQGCNRHRVDLVPMTTDRPYADALAEYLAVRKRR